MKMGLEIQDIKKLINRNAKVILLIAIAFGVLCAAYKFINNYKGIESNDSTLDKETYTKQVDDYNNKIANLKKYVSGMDNTINKSSNYLFDNPIMNIDPYDCVTYSIYITFSNIDSKRTGLVSTWLSKYSGEKYYDGDSNYYNKYKNDFINVYGDIGEVYIDIYKIKELNVAELTKDLKKYIVNQAKKKNVSIDAIGSEKKVGHSKSLVDKQYVVRNEAITIMEQKANLEEKTRTMPQPKEPSTLDRKTVIKDSLIYLVFGMLLGIVIGLCVVLYRIKNGGYILSIDHMKRLFEIENLGTLTEADSSSEQVLRANICAFSKEKEKIVFIGDGKNDFSKKIKEFVVPDKTILYGNDIFDEPDTIKKVEESDGVVLCIKLMDSKFEMLQIITNKLANMNKDIIGFIVI